MESPDVALATSSFIPGSSLELFKGPSPLLIGSPSPRLVLDSL